MDTGRDLLLPAPDPVGSNGPLALRAPAGRGLEVSRGDTSPGQLMQEAAGMLTELATFLNSEWNKPVPILDQGGGRVPHVVS